MSDTVEQDGEGSIRSSARSTVQTMWARVKSATPDELESGTVEAAATSRSTGGRWKRAAGFAKFIGRLGKTPSGEEASTPLPPVEPSLKNMTLLQSLLVDICEATGHAYGEVWERPVKAKRRGRLFANVAGPSGQDEDGKTRRRTSLVNSLLATSSQGSDSIMAHKQGSAGLLPDGIAAGLPGLLGPEAEHTDNHRGRRGRSSISGASSDHPPAGPDLTSLPAGIAAGLPGLEGYGGGGGGGNGKTEGDARRRRSSISAVGDLVGDMAAVAMGRRRSSAMSCESQDGGGDALFERNDMQESRFQPRLRCAATFCADRMPPDPEGLREFTRSSAEVKYKQGSGLPGRAWHLKKLLNVDLANLHPSLEGDARLEMAHNFFTKAVAFPMETEGTVRAVIVLYQSSQVVSGEAVENILTEAARQLEHVISMHAGQSEWAKVMEDCHQNLENELPEDDIKIENCADVLEYVWVKNKLYWGKMAGQNHQPHSGYKLSYCLWSGFGVCLTLLLIVAIDHQLQGETYKNGTLFALIASFAAVATNLFSIPSSPMAQPRSVVVSHIVAVVVAVLVDYLTDQHLGLIPQWLAVSLAPALLAAVVSYMGTIHPPAGACAVLYIMGDEQVKNLGWLFLAVPVLLDVALVTFMALCINNLSKARAYPLYW